MFLFLDERGAKNFKDWKKRIEKSGEDYFFIGGIVVRNEEDKKDIIEFVRNFKYILHPDKQISDWELKGSKDPFYCKKDFAKHKWLLWSKYIYESKLNYTFYGCFLKLSYFFQIKNNRDEEKVVNTTLEELLYSFLSCECIEHQIDDLGLIKNYKFLKSNIIFDNASNSYRNNLKKCFEKINNKLKKHIKFKYNFISNQKEFDDGNHLVMQFVDMQIYALTRFLYPVNDNILLDFECYPKLLNKYRKNNDKTIFSLGRFEVQYYYDIAKIYYHLSNKFIRCGWTHDNQQLTSLILIADKIYKSFGIDVHIFMKDYLNTFKRPEFESYKILNDKSKVQKILND